MSVSRPSASRARVINHIGIGIAVATLFCAYTIEVAPAARGLSAIWDEPCHILAGYQNWRMGDYGLNPEHPPLAKLVGTLPLLFMNLKAPRVGRDASKPVVIIRGRTFVYHQDADAILFRARLAEAALGLVLIWLLCEAGRNMFGVGVGGAAALLALFEPNLLAHATVVGTDFALACFFFASVYAFWRVAEHPTMLRLIGCGVATGLALAAKHSALLLLPVLAGLAVYETARNSSKGNPADHVLKREIVAWSIRLLVIVATAVFVLWGVYAFRYRARPDSLPLWQTLPAYAGLLHSQMARGLVFAASRARLLPESYLFGLVDVLVITRGPRLSFLLGHLYPHAVWYYFPVAFVIKSTLGFLALLLLALVTFRLWSGPLHRNLVYLLLPPACLMGVAMTAGTNMGIRHVLPIYPFLILMAAAGAGTLAQRHKRWALLAAALLAWHAASSLRARPDYLAYSNELFGGTSRTYLSLSDSNVDWGQGIREAAHYLAQRDITDCWLANFGTADPAYYHLPCKPLPDPFLRWWKEPMPIPPETFHGVVLITATELAAPYWGHDELNPYSGFLHRKPDAVIGGSILVYQGDVDLRRAAATAHMYKAWDCIAAKRQEQAIQEALKAGDLAPDHPAPSFIVGYVLAQENRPEAARLQFETSLKLAQAAHPEFQWLWVKAAEAQLAALPKP